MIEMTYHVYLKQANQTSRVNPEPLYLMVNARLGVNYDTEVHYSYETLLLLVAFRPTNFFSENTFS
jgi:hypothetical protein